MVFLFPPFHAVGLVWITLVPLLAALWSLGETRRKRRAFVFGYLSGVAFFLPTLTWLREVSGLGWVVVALYLAVYPAMWAVFAATWGNPWRNPPAPDAGSRAVTLHSLRHAFACASVWAGFELLRGWMFTGFSWNTLGVAFHETPVIAQAADLLGATGLSFLPVFLQAVIVQVVRRMKEGIGRRQPRFDFLVAAVLLAAVTSYGVFRLASVGKGESIRLKALLVQLNIPQEASRQLMSATDIHLGYEDVTLSALDRIAESDQERLQAAMQDGDEGGIELKTPDWIVWPETALTGRILQTDSGQWAMGMENRITIDRIRSAGEFTLVMGVNEIEGEEVDEGFVMKPDARIFNSLAVLSPDEGLQTFRKHHLVIFGEYIPLVDKLPFLAEIYKQQAGVEYGGAFSPGEGTEPLALDLRGETVGLVPAVCFEDTVARLMRKFVRKGPQIIVNVTNDGWFKESQGAAQHFANARFRAIELRRPMLRCANTGVSAAVTATGVTASPNGGPVQELRDDHGSTFTRGSMLVELDIPKDPPTSLYAVIGDWGVAALAFAGVLLTIRRKPVS